MFSYDTRIVPYVRVIGRIQYKESWCHFTRCTNEYILYLMINGDMYLQEEKCKYHLKKGDVLLLEPNKEHKGYKEAPCEYFYIHFTLDGITEVLSAKEPTFMKELRVTQLASKEEDLYAPKGELSTMACLPKYYEQFTDKGAQGNLINAISHYYGRDIYYRRLASVEFQTFLILLSRRCLITYFSNHKNARPKKSSEAVDQLIHFINMKYAQKITSQQLVDEFEMNYDYLNRVFQKRTNQTIFEYLSVIRINHAADLIRTTNLKFRDVAYLVGMDDQFHFSKVFKRIIGETPTSFYERTHSGK